nr:hypothetical protein [Tanacetum cinerariifolium]
LPENYREICLKTISDIGDQEKKVKVFNEWEKFTSTNRESIESYYHRFIQLMNDLKRNKHCIDSQFLNNLQSEWKRHVTIVHQTKNLHEADFTQIYDFLKMNQDEVNELRAERLAKSHDPLALMAHSQNSFNFPTTHKDQSSSSTHSIGKLRMLEVMVGISLDSMLDKWHRISKDIMHGRMNRLVVVPGIANQSGSGNVVVTRAEGTRIGNQARCYNCRGLGHIARNCTARPRRRDAAYLQTQLLIAQKEEVGIQLQAKEFDFMAAAGDLDEIEEVNANYILMANLQQASTSGTQLDKALVYDTDGSAKNDNHITSVALSIVQSGGTVETSSAPNEETRAHQKTVYRNLIDQVA